MNWPRRFFTASVVVATVVLFVHGVMPAAAQPMPGSTSAPSHPSRPVQTGTPASVDLSTSAFEANGGVPSSAQPSTVLANAAQQVGIRRCYAAVESVSGRTIGGARSADVVLDWDRQDPDGAPFFSLTGMDYGRNTAAVLSLAAVPDTAGCTVLAERVSIAPLACRDVARSELAGYHASTLVPGITVYAVDAHRRSTVTLIEAPSSCVILRREARYAHEVAQ